MANARIVAKSCLLYRKTLKLSLLNKQVDIKFGVLWYSHFSVAGNSSSIKTFKCFKSQNQNSESYLGEKSCQNGFV